MARSLLVLLLLGGTAAATDITGRATVIDGDTLAVEGAPLRIRLDGIDAPEGAQTCLDASGAKYLCGTRASEALSALIGRNGRVSCEPKSLDRYGRQVATCRVDGKDISSELVRQGWAVDYVQYSGGRYQAEEKDAKAARRGLWVGAFQMPWDWRLEKRQPTRPPAVPVPLLAQSGPTTNATSCKTVTSCRDAVILWCGGYRRADADGDGIPCENVCRSLKQVEPIKTEIGCTLSN